MTRRTWRARTASTLVAVLAAAALVVSGCSSTPPETESSDGPVTRGDVLTYASAQGVTSLDPSQSQERLTAVPVTQAYGSVIRIDADGQFVPGYADSWGYVGEGLTEFEFTLKPDLLFADGTPLDADAAAASINYFVTGTNTGAIAMKDTTAEAVDELTVRLTSSTPNPSFEELLSPLHLAGALISPTGLADPSRLGSETFGAGPFVLDTEKTVANDTYYYDINPNYWDYEQVGYDEFVVRVITSPSSQFQAMQAGQVDVMLTYDSAVNAQAQALGMDTTSENYYGWDGIHFGDRTGELVPALGDVRVRQAINYAIDREELAAAFYGELGTGSSNVSLPAWPGFDASNDEFYTYDPDRAKELLQEAGYGDGFSFTLEYIANGSALDQTVQAVAQQLAEVGITMELHPSATSAEHFQNVFSGQFPAFTIPVTIANPWVLYQQHWTSDASANPLGATDPDLQAAIDAASALTGDEAAAAWAEANTILLEEAWEAPIVRYKVSWITGAEVSGVTIDPLTNIIDFSMLHPEG